MIERKAKRILSLGFTVLLGGGLYLLANNYGNKMEAYNIMIDLDNAIPFIPEAIIIYLLIFPFFLAAPVFLVKKYSDFQHVIDAYLLLIIVSFVFFILYPTTMPRPEISRDGFIGWLFWITRLIDKPHNLFPSLHVSSVIYVALLNSQFSPAWRWLSWVGAILISASTLLVKQHAILDVAGGAVYGITAYVFFRVRMAQDAQLAEEGVNGQNAIK